MACRGRFCRALICFKLQNTWDHINAVVEPRGTATVPDLIYRNVGLAVGGNVWRAATRQSCAGINRRTSKSGREELMSAAEQAFLLTGGLFVLSFVAIFAFWFADKLRRNFFGTR